MRFTVRLSSALGLLAALVALHPAISQANCPPLSLNQVCYDEPAVDQQTTNTGYTFPAGSHVRIQADGCEQTGGSGETWKRYVNPDPSNGNTEFHGRVGIYSSTGGPTTLGNTRILSIDQSAYHRVTTPSYLQVGFEDDDYTDNNYDSHDDGGGQCAWNTTGSPVSGTFYGTWGYGGPAYILLTVVPNAAPVPSANQPAAYVSGLVSLGGGATDADADTLTYDFLVDGNDVSGSRSSASYTWNSAGVADGQHSVALKASDPYTSATSTSRTFQVDNTSPTVAITGGPNNQTFGPGSTQTWTFTASDGAGSGIQGIQCRIDGTPVTCTSATSHSVSNLAGGAHTFSMQAVDKVGHVSATPSRSFAIDATPPDTTVTAGPAEGASTTDTSVTYVLASSEQSSSFLCRVYVDEPSPVKPAFTACSAGDTDVISNLSPGSYVFEGSAVDAYGNEDPTPAVRHFSIVAPASAGGTPAGGSTPGSGGSGLGDAGTLSGVPLTVPVAPAAPKAQPAIHATLVYAYKSPTRLTRLILKHVPPGSTVRLTCHGKCPKALRRQYTKRHVSGSLSLTRLVKRTLKPGVRLSIVISKPGWRSMTKTVRIRRGKRPLVR
jgi:hypothetical protein